MSDNDNAADRWLFESINALVEREHDLSAAFSALINALALLILESSCNSPEEVKCLLNQIVDGLNTTVTNNMLMACEIKKEMRH